MVTRLRQWGAIPIWTPVIAATPGTPRQLARALVAVQACDWLVLPSPLAIEVCCEVVTPVLPVTAWPRTVVMGETSRRLLVNRYGIEPAVVCDFRHNAALVTQMGLQGHERVVILRSCRGPGPRVAALARCHAHVDSHVVYAVNCAENLTQILGQLMEPFDAVTFTSPSSVDCFVDAAGQLPHLRDWLAQACIACIGTSTAQASLRHGFPAQVICVQPSAENLLVDLARWFTSSCLPVHLPECS